ncbi:MAG: BON domain-containing protein [Steroidobacteraceae bacterium]
MKRISRLLGLLVAASISPPAWVQDAPGQLTLPPTSTSRVENNPAKAAILAREAQKKDANAAKEQKAAAATAEAERLMQSVEAALQKDARTAKLGVEVRVNSEGVVSLHGTVASKQSLTAAGSVASNAVAPAQIENKLVILAK